MLHLSHRFGVGAIDLHRLGVGGLFPTGREARREIARTHHHNLNAKLLCFKPQRFAIALNGKLAGGVETLERQSHHTTDGAQRNDFAFSLLTHNGQHGGHEMHQPHEVGVHLLPNLLFGGKLHRPADTHAGIVDQHINTTFLFNNLLHNIFHSFAVADIHFQIMHSRQRFHVATNGTINSVSLLRKQPGSLQTETR